MWNALSFNIWIKLVSQKIPKIGSAELNSMSLCQVEYLVSAAHLYLISLSPIGLGSFCHSLSFVHMLLRKYIMDFGFPLSFFFFFFLVAVSFYFLNWSYAPLVIKCSGWSCDIHGALLKPGKVKVCATDYEEGKKDMEHFEAEKQMEHWDLNEQQALFSSLVFLFFFFPRWWGFVQRSSKVGNSFLPE